MRKLFAGLLTCSMALLLNVVLCAQAGAATIESLVMPGEVIAGHKKLETDCSQCHERFDRKKQKSKCLACHKKIKQDIGKHTGYHGRKQSIREHECNICHTEHKGRAADIVKLNTLTFEHQFTDFKLRGEHVKVKCTACHKPNKKYRDAPLACISCHKKDNKHNAKTMGKVMSRCNACHNEKNWHQAGYKHAKSKLPDTGKHRRVACNNCHIAGQYIKTPKVCVACHKADDVHRNANGSKCQQCHSMHGWKKLSFDHAKDTDFPLRGKHKVLVCQSCHKKDPYRVKIKSSCVSCHQHDDRHKGRFGEKCQTCHNESGWSKHKFNHNRQTKFKLRGKHAQTGCGSCHKKHLYKSKTSTACYSCHKLDDVHKGRQGKKCNKCHNESGWTSKVRFDHDISRFPLIGLHAVVPCEECHISNDYRSASIQCNSCHKRDDEHKGRLGTDCQRCHNPNGWSVWRFDHDLQSQFKLTGAHKKTHCYSCHISAVEKIESSPRNCVACHRADDEHNGQFGPRCNRCHNTKTFTDVQMRR